MFVHKDLAAGRWGELSLNAQLGNVGSEVSRLLNRMKNGNSIAAQQTFERALELIDLTVFFAERYPVLKEICRLRECFIQAYMEKNNQELEYINTYLYYFAYAERNKIK
ncbi:MAG: hypothetical protein LBR17_08190 [Bacteroidales bacterium]|jgi:hypothetical protein|nr:hypothetical protein [Bacteroidales bacterium]